MNQVTLWCKKRLRWEGTIVKDTVIVYCPAKNSPSFSGKFSYCLIDIYGNRLWYRDGFLHRLDGPAVEWINGDKEWWINGAPSSKESFELFVSSF